jgi:hypothetical protein
MLRLTFLVSVIASLEGGAPSDAAEPLPPAKGAVLLTASGKIEQTNGPGREVLDGALSNGLARGSSRAAFAMIGDRDPSVGVPLRAVKWDGELFKGRERGPLSISYSRDDHGALRYDFHDPRSVGPFNRLQIVPP